MSNIREGKLIKVITIVEIITMKSQTCVVKRKDGRIKNVFKTPTTLLKGM